MPPHAHYDAVLFDLDGVLTATAGLHAAAWKQTFDPFLAARGAAAVRRAARLRRPRRRQAARGRRARLPPRPRDRRRGDDGAADRRRQAGPGRGGAGRGRDRGVPRLGALGARLRAEGVPTAVVSSSANARAVLRAAGIDELFDLTVDGGDVARLGPARQAGARRRSSRRPVASASAAHAAVVVEDAVAGVAAGRAGGFGLVIGVDRTADARRAAAPRAPTSSSTTSRRWSDERLVHHPARVRRRPRRRASRRCSRSPTATSACAARTTRACRRTTPA